MPPVDSCSDHVGEVEKKCGIGSRGGPIKITVETRTLIGRNRRQTSSCRLDFLSAQAPPLLPRPTRRAGCHSKRAREIASGHRSLVRLPARSPRVRLSLICRVRLFRRGLAQNDRASRLSPTHFRYRLSHLPSQPFAGLRIPLIDTPVYTSAPRLPAENTGGWRSDDPAESRTLVLALPAGTWGHSYRQRATLLTRRFLRPRHSFRTTSGILTKCDHLRSTIGSSHAVRLVPALAVLRF